MKILVINSGSSSIKYALFDSEKKHLKRPHLSVGQDRPTELSSFPRKCEESGLILKGKVERIGETGCAIDHRSAMEQLFKEIHEKYDGEINGVGHRIVHGGEQLRNPTLINKEVIEQIKNVGHFVPLHSTPNLIGIEVAQNKLSSIPHIAVFDTGAFATLEAKAFLYAIPLKFYEEHRIRKYGFHGINHSYVMQQVSDLLGKQKLKVITCHLGNGCSIAAFENGLSRDTSMGFTPLEGLVMGSRCGDIDPTILLYLMDILKFDTERISELLNKKSGLLGLCGSNDMRDIHLMAAKGNVAAKLAIEIFVYRLQKYVGAYIAVLNGIDVIAFTGGIGENDAIIREKVMCHFSYINAYVDQEKNHKNERIFSARNSEVNLMNITANEELAIFQQTTYVIDKIR